MIRSRESRDSSSANLILEAQSWDQGEEDESSLELVCTRPASLANVPMHFCPGCTHGVIHRLIAEAIDELGIQSRTICVAPVGCAVFAYNYFEVDGCVAAHGRAPAMATGLKRVLPERVIFTYQGDGDLAAIGGNEILHAAARGEQITAFFVNNTVYGMTGGQYAPTSLPQQVTPSTPVGRNIPQHGYPLHITEMLALSQGVAYAVRRSVHSPAEIRRTRKAVVTALRAQMMGLGMSIVEILSTCPTNWHMKPAESLVHVRDHVAAVFPLGDFRVHEALR